MAVIQELLQGRNESIDYDLLLSQYPWIAERNKFCVLSPDSDGLLCGLFMSQVRGWKVVGFYDDKVSVINKNFVSKDVVFLDGEIFRKGARSMGHHMVCLNNKKRQLLSDGFANCIQPNLMRNYDGKHHFRLKYPLATIHMLVSIIAYADKDTDHPVCLSKEAVSPLFFTDGVFNVLFSYPENVLNWFHYLRIGENWNPLKNIFENSMSVFETMQMMDEFFRMRDSISVGSERGDRLKISDKRGEPYNIEGLGSGSVHINEDAAQRIKEFCSLVGGLTGWQFVENQWQCWQGLKYYKFTKSSFKSDARKMTVAAFEDFILNIKPLSWAQTSTTDIEYTKEHPDKFDFL